MKIEMVKFAGGLLSPANDMEEQKLSKFKTGDLYTIEIKLPRNPKFHAKVFAFFNFCFNYWKGDNEYQDEAKQFDVFRNHLTCLAGFYNSYSGIDGRTRVEAKSLAFGNMTQEEFESCYNAMINAAMAHIFNKPDDNTYNKLQSFF